MFIKEVEISISYDFKLKHLLIEALTHKSCGKDYNYEKLEFLGDRVLGICISSIIYYKYKDFDEGNLTKKLSYLVQKDFLYKIALELKIENLLFYSYKRKNSIILNN